MCQRSVHGVLKRVEIPKDAQVVMSYRFRYEIERHFRKNTSYCKLGKCCIPTGDVFGSNVSFQLSRNKSKAVLKQDSKMNQGILRYPPLSLCFLICFILSGCIHRINTIDY